METPAPVKDKTALPVASLIAAVALYPLSLLFLDDLTRGNPAEPGFGPLAAAATTLMLWGALAAFVVNRLKRANTAPAIAACSVVALIVCALASLWATSQVGAWASRLMGVANWIRGTPTLLPPLFLLYAFTMDRTRERTAAERRRIAIAFAAGALALSILPVVEHRAQMAMFDRLDELDAADAARDEAAFQSLGPDSRLDDLLPHLANQSRAAQALEKISTVRSRQADAERLLVGARLSRLDQLARLAEFDIEATPELCRRYRAAIDRANANFANPDLAARTYAHHFRDQVPNLRWFMAQDCDLSAELNRAAAEIRARREFGSTETANALDAIPVPGPAEQESR